MREHLERFLFYTGVILGIIGGMLFVANVVLQVWK